MNVSGNVPVPLNNWSLVTWTMSPFGDYGKGQVVFYVGTAARPQAASYFSRAAYSGDLNIGTNWGSMYYTGRIDGLLFAGRTWALSDVSMYYNSGAGRSFPFY